MNQRIAYSYFLLGILMMTCFGCIKTQDGQRRRKPLKVIEVQGGSTIPFYGFSIDAFYDPRLDHLVPGYKLLNVGIRNISPFVVPMDAKKDRWILVDKIGKKHRIVNSIRVRNERLWRELPSELRHRMEYAENVPISYEVTFNLLFSERVDAHEFEELHYYNAAWKRTFVITKY